MSYLNINQEIMKFRPSMLFRPTRFSKGELRGIIYDATNAIQDTLEDELLLMPMSNHENTFRMKTRDNKLKGTISYYPSSEFAYNGKTAKFGNDRLEFDINYDVCGAEDKTRFNEINYVLKESYRRNGYFAINKIDHFLRAIFFMNEES